MCERNGDVFLSSDERHRDGQTVLLREVQSAAVPPHCRSCAFASARLQGPSKPRRVGPCGAARRRGPLQPRAQRRPLPPARTPTHAHAHAHALPAKLNPLSSHAPPRRPSNRGRGGQGSRGGQPAPAANGHRGRRVVRRDVQSDTDPIRRRRTQLYELGGSHGSSRRWLAGSLACWSWACLRMQQSEGVTPLVTVVPGPSSRRRPLGTPAPRGHCTVALDRLALPCSPCSDPTACSFISRTLRRALLTSRPVSPQFPLHPTVCSLLRYFCKQLVL